MIIKVNYNMYTPKYLSKSKKETSHVWLDALFFPGAILYGELLFRLFVADIAFFSAAFFRVLFFSLATGLFVYTLLSFTHRRTVRRGIAIGLLTAGAVVLCVQYCCKGFFRIYFPFLYVLNMSGQATGDFSGNIVDVIFSSAGNAISRTRDTT